MTPKDRESYIGQRATLPVPMRDGSELRVAVKIMDARDSFGRIDVLVSPENGSGEAWVSADRVKVRGK